MSLTFRRLNNIINNTKCNDKIYEYIIVNNKSILLCIIHNDSIGETTLYINYGDKDDIFDAVGYFVFKEGEIRGSNKNCHSGIYYPIEFKLEDPIDTIIDKMNNGHFIYNIIKLFIKHQL